MNSKQTSKTKNGSISRNNTTKKNYHKLYERIAKSKWFQHAYFGKSLGDFKTIE